MIGVISNDHCVLEWDLDSPRLSSQLAVHLESHLGRHGHQTLGLAQHCGRHALAWNRILNATLFLHCGVVFT